MIPIIASNPNCDYSLLNNLALSCPRNVLSNPILGMADIEQGNGYSQFSLKSLVSLSMACNPEEHSGLLQEIKTRLVKCIGEFWIQEEASLTCVWLYRREFTLMPDDCGGLIQEPVELCIEHRGLGIEGEGPISICGDFPDIHGHDKVRCIDARRRSLVEFLDAIKRGEIGEYVDDGEITRDHHGDSATSLKLKSLPQGLFLDDCGLYSGSWDDEDGPQLICEFIADWNGSGDGPIKAKGTQLIIPVEWVGEFDVEYDIAMGELRELAGLTINDPKTRLCIDWPSRLADLLLQL